MSRLRRAVVALADVVVMVLIYLRLVRPPDGA